MSTDRRTRGAAAGQAGTDLRYPLVEVRAASPYQLTVNDVSDRCGLPPDLLRRFVALGLVDARRDTLGRLWFRPAAPAVIARAQRLRTGLSLNYAAVGVVLDLLDRIDRLEAALRRGERAAEERTRWT
jgi:chaperone modulatory protein CbpM